MFFKIAGSPYDGSFIQSGIKWLDRDFPQGKKACQTRTAQRTAIQTHCFSLKFRCFFDMIASL